MAQIKDNTAKLLAAIRAERAALVPKPDRSDIFAEMQRAEARSWLRSLSNIERMRVAYESSDPILREAIAYAAPQLSGVTSELKEHVINAMVKERHGERLQGLSDREEALEAVQSACQLAGDDLRREAEPTANRLTAVG